MYGKNCSERCGWGWGDHWHVHLVGYEMPCPAHQNGRSPAPWQHAQRGIHSGGAVLVLRKYGSDKNEKPNKSFKANYISIMLFEDNQKSCINY